MHFQGKPPFTPMKVSLTDNTQSMTGLKFDLDLISLLVDEEVFENTL